MRNYELIKAIYEMASDYPYPVAIKKLIEEERPELKSKNHYPQQEAGMDY
jgi:hypothetical protein